MSAKFFVPSLALALTMFACSPATLSPHTTPTCTLNMPLKGAVLPASDDATKGAYLKSKDYNVRAIRGGRLVSDIFIDIEGQFQTGSSRASNCIGVQTEIDSATGAHMVDVYCWMQSFANFPKTNCTGNGGLQLCSAEDITPGQYLGQLTRLHFLKPNLQFLF